MAHTLRIATLDLGTNTLLALDAEASAGEVRRVADHIDIVRLGEGLDASGVLGEAAMGRALAVLSRHGERLARERPDRVRAVATEAVRKAGNAAAFLVRAEAALGFPVEVIDGQREAELSWLATARSIASGGGPRTVLEIGGGSTQIMHGSPAEPRPAAARSLAIGSVRLTERHIAHDPPTDAERAALAATVDAAIAGAPFGDARGDLVGIAGTITTLAAIHLDLPDYDPDRVHGLVLSRAELEATVERLGRMRRDERLRLRGLDPKREAVIYAGAVIAGRVLLRGGFSSLTVSDRGIRWGLAYEIAEAGAPAARR